MFYIFVHYILHYYNFLMNILLYNIIFFISVCILMQMQTEMKIKY